MRSKLFQYNEVTGNAGASQNSGENKYAAMQCIKLIMVICVLQQIVRQIQI